MSMTQSTTAKSAKRRRLHKRSIAVAFFVVLLPWILVPIPSTVVGLGGSTGSEIIHSVHGWPDKTISQREQLQPFVGLPSLRWASVSGLSTKRAEFILETKTKWPKVMMFGSMMDEVSEELKEKLESEFEEEIPDTDSH